MLGSVRTVEIDWAEDDPAIDVLLREWKGKSHGGLRYRYLLARVDGDAVGVLEGHHEWANWHLLEDWQHLLGTPARGSYLRSLFVRPAHRRHGLGGLLLERFVLDARERGRAVVVAWPDEAGVGRDDRLRFFRHHGFEFARYPRGGRDPWLMTRALGVH